MSFFDLDEASKQTRAEQLAAKDPDGSKQLEQLSEHAPGPVADEELLARSLEYPNKFDPSGGLNDSFFGDAFTHGASVQRLPHGWDHHSADVHRGFEARAQARREGSTKRKPAPENLYIGAFHMTAGELRAFKLEADARSRVRVYDAGHHADDALHADVIADSSGLEKHLKHELRVRLMRLAEQRGLYVSPYLPQEAHQRAESTGCHLHPSQALALVQG